MRRRWAVALVVGAVTLHAQEPDVQQYVAMAEAGDSETVRGQLPSLLKQYPNHPGVLYLQALLTTDGAEAVRQYQYIVDSYPTSEWADDALYKIYKFYYALGLYRTAEQKLDLLRTKYPKSRYVAGAADAAQAQAETTAVESRGATGEKPQTPVTEPPSTPIATPEKGQKTSDRSAREEAPPVTAPARVFTVQVGAYSTEANANRQKAFLDYHNYAADVVRRRRGDKDVFVVYVGTFATDDEARRTGEQLRRTFNIEYIIVTR